MVDAAYVTAQRIEHAPRVHQITLLGPVAPATRPKHRTGSTWHPSPSTGTATRPSAPAGRPAKPGSHCGSPATTTSRSASARPHAGPARTGPGAPTPCPRSLALLPTRELHGIQQANRLDQRTRQWQDRYAIRAGIEATLSQNIRTCGLRRTRYRGLRKTHVQHILTVLACNVTQIADWIATPTQK